MRTAILFLTVVCCFTNCDSKFNENSSKEGMTEIDSSRQSIFNHDSVVVLDDSLLLKTESLSKDSYALHVESYFFMKEAEYENTHLDRVVQKQVLKFSHNDTILKTLLLPVKKINVEGIKEDELFSVQENILYDICIIIGGRDWLYFIQGSGVTDGQTEYYGLFSKKGKLVWYSYTSYQNIRKVQQEIPDEGFGNLDKVLIEYDIIEQKLNNPTFCKKIFLDPAGSGSTN